jgi:NAD(P)-dependent dehydrogenase (short-subunit alcohol dehydrogenase family)
MINPRRILITGAGSGLGEGAAIGLAKLGHYVIAGAQAWPQVTALRSKAEKLRIATLRIEKLDLLDSYEVKQACNWEFDVLVNNAGIGEGGPVAEIPVELVRRNFEVNVFAPLTLTQQVVRNWVSARTPGKVVFISSIGGLFSPPGFAAYAATKHAIEAIAEAMQLELKAFGIQVQTINPGAYLTGFNEAMAESALRWLNDGTHFTTEAKFREFVSGLIGNGDGRLDPTEMIAKMIELIPAASGRFRNLFPPFVEERLRAHQIEMFSREI